MLTDFDKFLLDENSYVYKNYEYATVLKARTKPNIYFLLQSSIYAKDDLKVYGIFNSDTKKLYRFQLFAQSYLFDDDFRSAFESTMEVGVIPFIEFDQKLEESIRDFTKAHKEELYTLIDKDTVIKETSSWLPPFNLYYRAIEAYIKDDPNIISPEPFLSRPFEYKRDYIFIADYIDNPEETIQKATLKWINSKVPYNEATNIHVAKILCRQEYMENTYQDLCNSQNNPYSKRREIFSALSKDHSIVNVTVCFKNDCFSKVSKKILLDAISNPKKEYAYCALPISQSLIDDIVCIKWRNKVIYSA